MASSYNDGATFPPPPSSMTAYQYPNNSVPSSSNNFNYAGNNVPSTPTFKHPGNVMPSTSCFPQPGLNNNVQNGAYRRIPNQQLGNMNAQQFNQQPGPSSAVNFNYPAQPGHNFQYQPPASAPRPGLKYGSRPTAEPVPGPSSIEANGGFLHPGSVIPSTSRQSFGEEDCNITRLIFETMNNPEYNKKDLSDNIFDALISFRMEYEDRHRAMLLDPDPEIFPPNELANIDSIKAAIIPKCYQTTTGMIRTPNPQQMPTMRPPNYVQPSRITPNVYQQRPQLMNPPVPMQSPQYRPMIKNEVQSPSYGPTSVGAPVRMSAISPKEQAEVKQNMLMEMQRQNSGKVKQEVMSPESLERPLDVLPVQPKNYEKFQRQTSTGQFMMNSPQSNGLFSSPPPGHQLSRHPSMGQPSPAQIVGSSPRTSTPGINQPECPILKAALNGRNLPNGPQSQFNTSNPLQNFVEDRRQSCNSPASQASADSTGGKRKRPTDEDGKEPTSKRPKLNTTGDHYRNVVNFLRENLDMSQMPLLRFLFAFTESTERQSKRVVDFKDDDPRTLVVLKPRVFCDRWKEQCGIPLTDKTTRETPTYAKMENELVKTTAVKFGDYPLVSLIGTREFQLLKGFKETDMLRQNKSKLFLENGKIVERQFVQNGFSHPSTLPSNISQQQQQFVPSQRIIPPGPSSFIPIPRLPDQIASK